ncbi:cupin domain-containing protein [Yoonia sediminilitoris]|uniref:Cupin domain-containing protein n=1 Tax=Yoonia sediminilitoris TaxID=1286148 RepID=A0A2T6K105_9RHOB|nr:cupin domain-containing protein [Yoonia sediminilitoris]PUB08314.1 Cupin domain-containing protein [Yoonia sediminilitoris]RCW89418.1 cupin domain [Yoonia sediminilitoris]
MRTPLTIILMALAGAAGAHEPMEWNGSKIHVLLERDGTEGSMGMFTTQSSAPGGPPLHIHEDAGEALFVLEGRAEFQSGDQYVTLGAGEVVFVPRGVDHTFHFPDATGGKLLVIVTPGGFEGFFSATRHLKLPDQLDELSRISAGFGQVFTGPPLGAH